MTPMQQIQNLFAPLLGQLAWNVRCGHGSLLTFEFGNPHIVIREPIIASPGRDAKVRRALRRRRVYVVGDWHLWIQYCDWKISVADGSVDSDSDGLSSNECLLDLEGQHLVSVTNGSLPNSCKFEFDRGGVLELWPSSEYEPTDNMWTLYRWNDGIGDLRAVGALRNDGTLDAAGSGLESIKS